jgi:cell division protein FtsI (penicillin-binding protein 3)
MHIASFAGFAPVNNPAIAVAVVIDDPKGGSYYGTAVSAPVFTEVAQQVLEYLGVTHDIDLKPSSMKAIAPMKEDDAPQDQSDIQALYAAANDLPSDDPLRGAPAQDNVPSTNVATANVKTTPHPGISPPPSQKAATPQMPAMPAQQQRTVMLADNSKKVSVPSLLGLPVRKVIEQAATSGLQVQIVGNGIARQQAPPPGTMVPAGTRIVVKCGR